MSGLLKKLRDRMSPKTTTHGGFTVPSRTYGFPPEAFDPTRLPDWDTEFLPQEHLDAFVQALAAPDPIPETPDDYGGSSTFRLNSPVRQRTDSVDVGFSKRHRLSSMSLGDDGRGSRDAAAAADAAGPGSARTPALQSRRPSNTSMLFSAHNDWAPINEKVVRDEDTSAVSRRTKKKKKKTKLRRTGRTRDETREGYLYSLLKWPFLAIVLAWIVGLAVAYLVTRTYIYLYEQFVAWRGKRESLRRAMRATSRYRDWVAAAKKMDDYFGNGRWKEVDEFAYYDSKTVRRVLDELRRSRLRAQRCEGRPAGDEGQQATEELKVLVEACVKNNFVGVENPRLYSQTYYGTKNLVENFLDEVERCLRFLIETRQLTKAEKRVMFKGICANYGRTALCLSGGATFAYFHFGLVSALLEEDLLPDIITGTSGGALVAALVATRTDEELRQLLVPALAHRINACSESFLTWGVRWYKTGARFDSVDWARQCSWFTRGSMTFREAYERTGRILNVSCVPSDPHSPTILCNYLTSPDCVIWSAVLASAAVPGILNPVVLLSKTRSGRLAPYSFGHKWKDGSLRTDIPIKELNLHFNVNFTLVSQVNPHINLFFFSSRGSVGQPVTHRKGRGWRGGYLGSATEQYLKLDLTKWLRLLRQLELLPRWLGQDWSMLWLQPFGGTVTIWPTKTNPSDFAHILSDPDPPRLARMMHEGQQSVFPKIKFVRNRLRIERLVERGRRESRWGGDGGGGGGGGDGAVQQQQQQQQQPPPLAGVDAGLVNLSGGGGVDGAGGEKDALRKASIEEILSEGELRDLLRAREMRDGGDEENSLSSGSQSVSDEDTTDRSGSAEGSLFFGDDEDENGRARLATPMGLAGAEDQE